MIAYVEPAVRYNWQPYPNDGVPAYRCGNVVVMKLPWLSKWVGDYELDTWGIYTIKRGVGLVRHSNPSRPWFYGSRGQAMNGARGLLRQLIAEGGAHVQPQPKAPGLNAQGEKPAKRSARRKKSTRKGSN